MIVWEILATTEELVKMVLPHILVYALLDLRELIAKKVGKSLYV